VLTEVARKLGINVEEIRREAQRARAELSKAVRGFWDSPTGQKMRQLMSQIAHDTGYADEVKNIMQGVAADLKRVAEATNYGEALRWLWGKK